ncbi:ribonuclease D [Catenovulum sp. 2E275]|uniref:ribonuclease D n=1 Tax=Catenovulum sp. 2E275 TaxID=2980497 RepID=UPI0021D19F65|nr:ribonuclease D [Catenovulum sp. 2E275]MCU4674500.1 ribonuclease D [Catenovulum sp. 2E275]
MAFNIIDNDAQLLELSQHLSKQPYFAIDTEFVRERTYYPQLGLVQIYDGEQVYLIDPLTIHQWDSFKQLLENPQVIKIIHSCSEDIEVLKTAFNAKPQGLYDTQIAEGLISAKPAMGLAVLVEKYTQVQLDKGHARTNWLKRPLSQEQLKYAADDVLYLLSVYRQQQAILQQKNTEFIVFEDVNDIIEKKFKPNLPELAWRDVKSNWQLSPRELAILKELMAWRLEYAMKKDLAVNFVVHERSLLLLCQRRPGNLKSMSHIPGIHPLEIKRHGQRLLECIEKGKAVTEENCPQKIKRVAELAQYKKMYTALKSEIQNVANQQNLNIEVLASKRMINQYIGYYFEVTSWSKEEDPELSKGWRGELLNEKLHKKLSNFLG